MIFTLQSTLANRRWTKRSEYPVQGEKVVGFKEMAGEERRKEGAAAAGQRRRVEGKKKKR